MKELLVITWIARISAETIATARDAAITETTELPEKEDARMLMPKRVKFRRVQRGRLKGKAMRGNKVTNGTFGLAALEPAWITSNQIEAARIAMTRYIKRGG